jgi:hypothetical protein
MVTERTTYFHEDKQRRQCEKERQGVNMEKKIKAALEQQCSGVDASQDLKSRIDAEIMNHGQEERSIFMKMKHFGIKKVAIGVAAVCLLLSGGAFAAGHAVSLSSSTYVNDAYTTYGDMDKAQKKLGYAVDSVETFDNGYTFENMYVSDVDGWDEDGNKAYTYKEMLINYQKDGSHSLYLAIYRPVEEEQKTKTPDAARVCGDITLSYDIYTYKFVPADYELTEEDIANEAKDNYYISYGSDEVEITQSTGVTWTKDGIYYNLAGMDLGLSSDEMFDMAEEIMNAQ